MGHLVTVHVASSEADYTGAKRILDRCSRDVGFIFGAAVRRSMSQGELLVARHSDIFAGALRFHIRRDRVLTLYEIAVVDPFRGSGVGSEMIHFLKNHSRSKFRLIRLKCPEGLAANAFYARIGFTMTAKVPGRVRSLHQWEL